MSKFTSLIRKPTDIIDASIAGRFERYNLTENPFPSSPFVSQDSPDKRNNGSIFEMSIRQSVLDRIISAFLRTPQSNPNHIRMGYIMDTSHIGRGNGKTSFILNLIKLINKEYCGDYSNQMNKCFGLYLSPRPSGMTKLFDKFIDQLFQALYDTSIIDSALASIRLHALLEIREDFDPDAVFSDMEDLINKCNDRDWIKDVVSVFDLQHVINNNKYIRLLPDDFPMRHNTSSIALEFVRKNDFRERYQQIHKLEEKIQFFFSDLVNFFLAADFNGAYIFVDNFEVIPDFQSSRQKRDFAFNLRQCLYDGIYANSKIGFYNFFLVLHAGVPRLIEDAWAESGMENRIPLKSVHGEHIIKFENITKSNAELLLKEYLDSYRISPIEDELSPFDKASIQYIAEVNDVNAAKILKAAYLLMEKAAELGKERITLDFAKECLEGDNVPDSVKEQSITSMKPIDLEKITNE